MKRKAGLQASSAPCVCQPRTKPKSFNATITPLNAVRTSAVLEPPLGMTMPEGHSTGDAPKKPAELPLAKIMTPPLATTFPEIVGETMEGELMVELAIVTPLMVPPLMVPTFVTTPDKVEAKITAPLMVGAR